MSRRARIALRCHWRRKYGVPSATLSLYIGGRTWRRMQADPGAFIRWAEAATAGRRAWRDYP